MLPVLKLDPVGDTPPSSRKALPPVLLLPPLPTTADGMGKVGDAPENEDDEERQAGGDSEGVSKSRRPALPVRFNEMLPSPPPLPPVGWWPWWWWWWVGWPYWSWWSSEARSYWWLLLLLLPLPGARLKS
jgi:hypothetical protein